MTLLSVPDIGCHHGTLYLTPMQDHILYLLDLLTSGALLAATNRPNYHCVPELAVVGTCVTGTKVEGTSIGYHKSVWFLHENARLFAWVDRDTI